MTRLKCVNGCDLSVGHTQMCVDRLCAQLAAAEKDANFYCDKATSAESKLAAAERERDEAKKDAFECRLDRMPLDELRVRADLREQESARLAAENADLAAKVKQYEEAGRLVCEDAQRLAAESAALKEEVKRWQAIAEKRADDECRNLLRAERAEEANAAKDAEIAWLREAMKEARGRAERGRDLAVRKAMAAKADIWLRGDFGLLELAFFETRNLIDAALAPKGAEAPLEDPMNSRHEMHRMVRAGAFAALAATVASLPAPVASAESPPAASEAKPEKCPVCHGTRIVGGHPVSGVRFPCGLCSQTKPESATAEANECTSSTACFWIGGVLDCPKHGGGR